MADKAKEDAAGDASADAKVDAAEASKAEGAEAFATAVEALGKRRRETFAPKYANVAWGFAGVGLTTTMFPRKQCIWLLEQKWFDPFVLTLIMANCVTMVVINDPVLKRMLEGTGPGKDDILTAAPYLVATRRNYANFRPLGDCSIAGAGPCCVAQYIDLVFLILFAIEMCIKMCAQGLMMHPHSYLRQTWNWLDFLVVIVGFADMFTSGLPGISTLRLIKTLRPLRSMQRIRGLRVLVATILDAMPQMCNVLIFLVFTIFFFGLLGVNLFKGSLRHTCHEWDAEEGGWASTGATCNAECEWNEQGALTLVGKCKSLGASTRTEENFDVGLWTYSCRPHQQCRCESTGVDDPTCDYKSNPNYGITSFDSMPWAMISLFQAISLEGWVDMMYALMDGHSMWVFIYFVLVVLFGAIIVINLFLAVLCDNFEMADNQEEPDEENEEDEVGEEAVAKAVASLSHTNPFRQMCLDLVKNKYFDYFISGCIIFNTVVMAIKFAPQPTDPIRMSIYTDAQWDYLPFGYFLLLLVLNITLTAIFTFETIIKLIGLGRVFRKDPMNIFDFTVVVLSIVEIILDVLKKFAGAEFALPFPLSVLRAFRIFRLFKLVRSIESMRKIIVTLFASMFSVMYLLALLSLIILIFCLLGMELFGGSYPRPEYNYTALNFPYTFKTLTWPESEPSRYNFDDPFTAFLSIFVVLSGENWNEIMFHSHRATWDSDTHEDKMLTIPFALPYFIGLFIIGNLLLFNLFIAILLSNFGDDDDDEKEAKEKEEADKPTMMTFRFNYKDEAVAGATNVLNKLFKMESTVTSTDANGAAGAPASVEEDDGETKPAEKYPKDEAMSGGDKSCHVFAWSNPVRVWAAELVTHWLFEQIIIALILISTIMLLADMPHLPKEAPLKQVISQCNLVFAIIFGIEMLLKLIVHGVVTSKTPRTYLLGAPYFSDPWNWLDAFIVVVSFVTLAAPQYQMLRAIRALRPLRLVNRYEDLKITVMTLFKSVPAMGSLILVTLLFFFIFGILGLELYGGKLGYCMDPNYSDLPFGSRVVPGMNGSQSDYDECMSLSRYNITRYTTDGISFTDMANMYPDADPNWLTFCEYPQWFYPQWGNFDHITTSLMALFEISALEGWPDVMHNAMDTDSDNQFVTPWRLSVYGSHPDLKYGAWDENGNGFALQEHVHQYIATGLFFIAWIFLGCFVVVNMTIGVVCDTFADIKAGNDGLLLMSDEAADWVRAQKQIFAQRPLVPSSPPSAPWRRQLYAVVNSNKFDAAVMVVILLNMLQMAFSWWEPEVAWPNGQDQPPVEHASYIRDVKQTMRVINVIFLGLYICEMLIKWAGKTMKVYFSNGWDVFDFILVCAAIFELVVSQTGGGDFPFPPTLVRLLRLFRVVRLLRVIKMAKSLRTIIMTVWVSVPQLSNIFVLMTLIVIIFDILCVSLFWSVNYTPGNFDPTSAHDVSIQPRVVETADGRTVVARGEVLPWNMSDYDDIYFWSDDRTNWGDALNRHANFGYFWTGALMLVRASTGEFFNGIMHDCHSWSWGHNRLTCCPECGPIVNGDLQENVVIWSTGEIINRVTPETSCGNTSLAWILFFLFQMLMAYLVLSIMIGVIIENFANIGSSGGRLNIDDLEEFREVWVKFDPKGTFVTPAHNALAILQQLKQPLGIADSDTPKTRAQMFSLLRQLDIPVHEGKIHFMETLMAFANHSVGVPVPVCAATTKVAKSASKVPKLNGFEPPTHSVLSDYYASLLQARWHAFKVREGIEDLPGEGGDYDGDGASRQKGQKIKPNQVAPAQ